MGATRTAQIVPVFLVTLSTLDHQCSCPPVIGAVDQWMRAIFQPSSVCWSLALFDI